MTNLDRARRACAEAQKAYDRAPSGEKLRRHGVLMRARLDLLAAENAADRRGRLAA